jgi:hypothetical protein
MTMTVVTRDDIYYTYWHVAHEFAPGALRWPIGIWEMQNQFDCYIVVNWARKRVDLVACKHLDAQSDALHRGDESWFSASRAVPLACSGGAADREQQAILAKARAIDERLRLIPGTIPDPLRDEFSRMLVVRKYHDTREARG